MLKNMKIKKSLIMAFGITVLLSLVIIVATLFIMVSQANSYDSMIKTDIEANTLVVESRLQANIAARLVRNMALNPTDAGNANREQNIYSALEEMNTKTVEMRKICPEEHTTLLDSYLTAVNKWGNELPAILEAINANDQAKAIDLIQNSCTPLLNQMADAAQKLNAVLDAAKDEVIATQRRIVTWSIVIIAAVMVVVVIFVLILVTKIVKGITAPTEEIRKALVGFSEGNLRIPVNYESQNELGEMCNAMRKSQHILGGVIEDTCYLLEEMSKGNFDLQSKDRTLYVGALSSLLTSIRNINYNMSDTLAQISQSAEQVSAGAEQVSTSAQALAQGATEQASAVEELSATINEISNNAQVNAKNSENVMAHSQSAGQHVETSAQHMAQMVEAMKKISESSDEISKIIATIENIAFQTNILALNAAVEAARAGGSAGKGFAVVAAEVRSLASKSDQASKNTKALIERSVTAVKEGEEIVARVSEALSQTIDATGSAVTGIGEINQAVESEAESIAQIMEGIDQISSVVQTNSATSEESAAASEELSSQAALMKSLMNRFKLRGADNHGSGDSPVRRETYDGETDGGSSFSSKY